MRTSTSRIYNPFYAARHKHLTAQSKVSSADSQPRYARLPLAPRNSSPVPHLTSLYHFHRAGEYGDRSYPGNCGGNLIKDLLSYFRPGLVYDPMSGSGTCADVCREMNIPCLSFDIHQGFDACDPAGFGADDTFDFIWAHPAYWRQKLYADDPRDLSRAPTLERFLSRYGQFIRNCFNSLKVGGKLAILMGLCGARSYVRWMMILLGEHYLLVRTTLHNLLQNSLVSAGGIESPSIGAMSLQVAEERH